MFAILDSDDPEPPDTGDPGEMMDLGLHQPQPGMYFWFAPDNNLEAVAAIFIDRILLLKSP
jgi:hypothetical protein